MSLLNLSGCFFKVSTNPLNYLPMNILLKKSNDWKKGTIYVYDNPIHMLDSSIDNYIKLLIGREKYYLQVNNDIIYRHKHIFKYDLKVKLNEHIKDTPYANFLKLY